MALDLISSNEPISILLNDAHNKPSSIFNDANGCFIRLPVYTQHDTNISGVVKLNFGNTQVKHLGIIIQLIGETETYHNEDQPQKFLYKAQELEFPGKTNGNASFPFEFKDVDKRYETFYGIGGRIRYYIKAIIDREYKSPLTTETEFAVQLPVIGVMYTQGFEVQLRIADFLMIHVGINKTSFNMDECIIGKLAIEQIKLLIKKVQVSVVRREIFNPNQDVTCTKEEILTKVELTNKCPKKGDIIPFKLNLSSLNLSPSLLQYNMKFMTKHFLILSFIDEADRSLFKPVEINIWRKQE